MVDFIGSSLSQKNISEFEIYEQTDFVDMSTIHTTQNSFVDAVEIGAFKVDPLPGCRHQGVHVDDFVHRLCADRTSKFVKSEAYSAEDMHSLAGFFEKQARITLFKPRSRRFFLGGTSNRNCRIRI